MHRDQFDSYQYGERGVKRVLAAPRGYAKSSIKALLRIVWDVCYCQERYIIIASNTEEQSIQKLKDVRRELIENTQLHSVYGHFFSSSIISMRSFVADNDGHKVLLEAVGSKKEIRGKRFGEHRPSKIVVDDFEHSTEVESEVVREKAKALYRDVFERIGNKKTNIDVVGTVLHRKSLLKDILKTPEYEANTYKAIIDWSPRQDLWSKWTQIYTDLDNINHLADAEKFYNENKKEMLKGTKVLWEEHEDYLTLQKEIEHGKTIVHERKAKLSHVRR